MSGVCVDVGCTNTGVDTRPDAPIACGVPVVQRPVRCSLRRGQGSVVDRPDHFQRRWLDGRRDRQWIERHQGLVSPLFAAYFQSCVTKGPSFGWASPFLCSYHLFLSARLTLGLLGVWGHTRKRLFANIYSPLLNIDRDRLFTLDPRELVFEMKAAGYFPTRCPVLTYDMSSTDLVQLLQKCLALTYNDCFEMSGTDA
eukprot:752840-Rhodomonas_salina.1